MLLPLVIGCVQLVTQHVQMPRRTPYFAFSSACHHHPSLAQPPHMHPKADVLGLVLSSACITLVMACCAHKLGFSARNVQNPLPIFGCWQTTRGWLQVSLARAQCLCSTAVGWTCFATKSWYHRLTIQGTCVALWQVWFMCFYPKQVNLQHLQVCIRAFCHTRTLYKHVCMQGNSPLM